MGREAAEARKLFYQFRLEERVPADHVLRKLDRILNLDFLYDMLKEHYGSNGNVSIPPPVLMKMMLLLVLYNVRSERELMDTIPLRLDWLWFLGYDIDSDIPNHSVLSKARKRWGEETFRTLFERIVKQAVASGLVEGSQLFVDASLVEANASKNAVKDRESLQLDVQYGELLRRLDARETESDFQHSKVNKEKIITTDPDATITRDRQLSYKTHRTVDGRHEIITSCETTTGIQNEGQVLIKQLDQHEKITGMQPRTVIADSQYGTTENLIHVKKSGSVPHILSWSDTHRSSAFRSGVFGKDRFRYDGEQDRYICPAGHPLRAGKTDFRKKRTVYRASGRHCNHCPLKDQCTRTNNGRTLMRHLHENTLVQALEDTRSDAARRNLKTRQHLMERSYGTGIRFGYKQARWRGLWRVCIQQLLVASVQNLLKMAHYPDLKRAYTQAAYETVWLNSFSCFGPKGNAFWKVACA